MMGLEEHLIGMFRGDSEFHEDAAPSHLGGAARMQSAPSPAPEPVLTHEISQQTEQTEQPVQPAATPVAVSAATASVVTSAWDLDAEKELRKIPFFVRGKARRNTERYASERGLSVITTETLYDAKAYFAR
jgi:light-independent protochlorophyllide reductase subunit B